MNVNQKGTTAEAKVLVKLIDMGYQVFMPFSDASVIDMVASDSNGILRRIQVKYRAIEKRTQNRILIQMFSVVNGTKIDIDRSMVDGYAVYNPDFDRVYFLPMTILFNRVNTFLIEAESRKSAIQVLGNTFDDPVVLWTGGREV